MTRLVRMFASISALLTLAACGGGDSAPSSISEQAVATNPKFVTWIGNAGGEIVMDGNMDRFRVTAGERSCLHIEANGMTVVNWCRASTADPIFRLLFVNRYVNIRGSALKDGACQASLVDEATSKLVDVYFDANGTPQYNVTDFYPVMCNSVIVAAKAIHAENEAEMASGLFPQ